MVYVSANNSHAATTPGVESISVPSMSKRLVVYIRVSKTFNLLCDIVGYPHRIEVERCGRHGVCLAEQDRKEEDAMRENY